MPNKQFLDNQSFDNQFIIERKRVHNLLENAVKNSAVFVTAGEGYGKTCAVYSFLRQKDKAIIWLSLTERDNEPLHFWEGLVKAVSCHDLHIGNLLEEMGFPESPDKIAHCLSILSDKSLHKKQFAIVADNFHLIDEKVMLEFVSLILSSPYPKGTIIFISLREPKLNTMSLLSKGLLFRITVDDLRFTEEEIADYFRSKNITLPHEDAKNIFVDTEGWALAIHHIAEEMEKTKNVKYSRCILHEGCVSNMIDALFTSIPVSYQRFLVTISLFDKWPLEVISKIIESLKETLPPQEKQIEYLNRLSALYYYDVYLHGFRMHSLFLDYLRKKQISLSRQEIKSACSISAQWCMENRLLTDAAASYGMAGDYAGVLKAIYSSPRIMSLAAAGSFLEIIERLPSNHEHNDQNEDNKNFLLLRHVARAVLLMNLGRYNESKSSLEKSILEFKALPPGPLTFWILSLCYNTLGSLNIFFYRTTRDISNVVEYFRLGNYYYMRNPYIVSASMTKTSIGSYANLIGSSPREGEFEKYIDTIAQCIPHASNSITGYLCGGDSLCRAELAYFRGELDTAEQHAREAVFKAREKNQYEIESKSLFYLLRMYICTGNIDAGRQTWARLDAMLDIPDYINRYAIYDIITGWIYAHTATVEKIAPWLKDEFDDSDLNPNYQNYETMVKAKSLFAEKRYADTIKFLERDNIQNDLGSFHFGALEIAVLKMAALHRIGNDVAARQTLETAYGMALAGSHSGATFDMPFIELGEDMRNIANAVLSSTNAAPPAAALELNRKWLETIRGKAAVYAKKLATAAEQYRKEDDIPFFTAQELSVLASISKGLTREKIAEDTSFSISAVKKIIKTIYEKLGAINRADAIRIATGMGLLK